MKSLRMLVPLLAAIGMPLVQSGAQSSAKPIEIGIDAALQRQSFEYENADGSITSFRLPASQVRVGFFVNDKFSIEPVLGLQYFKGEDSDAYTQYALGLGVLYHFTADAAKPRAYVRPLIGFVGANGGGDSESATAFGIGLGAKLPIVDRLAFRAEVNYAKQSKTDSDPAISTIGLTFGLSFFTR